MSLLKRQVRYCFFLQHDFTVKSQGNNLLRKHCNHCNVPFLFCKADLRKNVDWIDFRRLKEISSYSVVIYFFPFSQVWKTGFYLSQETKLSKYRLVMLWAQAISYTPGVPKYTYKSKLHFTSLTPNRVAL